MGNEVLAGDRYFKDFLGSVGSRTTQGVYQASWGSFLEFYREVKGEEVTPALLLERVVEDRKRPLKDQGRPEAEFTEWAHWLLSGYQMRGRDGSKTGRTGISAGSVRAYATAVKSFHSYHGCPMGTKAKLPRAVKTNSGKLENIKIEYRPEQVKRLLSVIRSLRDRAIVLIMFQSGMDISTACGLDYGHVKEELEAGKEPLLINVTRPKVGLNYRTLIGKDAIEVLKAYLDERVKKRGEKLGYETPLFLIEGTHVNKGKRCTPKYFQDNMRQYVVAAGLVSEERMERADFSPARPHALRSGFSSILRLKGANERLIDYWMGHADPYGGAYNQATNEELREFYKGFEQHLSVSGVSSLGEIEERLRKELEKRDYVIKGMDERIAFLAGLLQEHAGIRKDEIDLQRVKADYHGPIPGPEARGHWHKGEERPTPKGKG